MREMTMDDEEILKLWDEIHRQEYIGQPHCATREGDKKVAIRLYQMAYDHGLNQSWKDDQKRIEQARASEREKCKLEEAEAVMNAIKQGMAHGEQEYANGYKKGQANERKNNTNKTGVLYLSIAEEMEMKHKAKQEGQAELIEELRDKRYSKCWKQLQLLLKDRQRASLFATEEAVASSRSKLLRKFAEASESLGTDKSDNSPRQTGYSEKSPKPEKPKAKTVKCYGCGKGMYSLSGYVDYDYRTMTKEDEFAQFCNKKCWENRKRL
jgi:hypothetical protein